MTIIYTQKAGETFQRNIHYLKDNWTQNEVDKFVARVFEYFEFWVANLLSPAEPIKLKTPTLV